MRNRSGQGLVEYVLIVALVAVTLVAALLLFQQAAANIFQSATTAVECPGPGQGGANPGNGGGVAPGQCKQGR